MALSWNASKSDYVSRVQPNYDPRHTGSSRKAGVDIPQPVGPIRTNRLDLHKLPIPGDLTFLAVGLVVVVGRVDHLVLDLEAGAVGELFDHGQLFSSASFA